MKLKIINVKHYLSLQVFIQVLKSQYQYHNQAKSTSVHTFNQLYMSHKHTLQSFPPAASKWGIDHEVTGNGEKDIHWRL